MGSLIEAKNKLAGKKRSKHSVGEMIDQGINKYGNMARGAAKKITSQDLRDKANGFVKDKVNKAAKFAKVASDTFSNVKNKATDLSRSAKDSMFKTLPRARGGKVKKSLRS